MKKKQMVFMNLIVDVLAILYFVYKYFIQVAILSITGEELTIYQFWGLRHLNIIAHFAIVPFVIIILTLMVSIVIMRVTKKRA